MPGVYWHLRCILKVAPSVFWVILERAEVAVQVCRTRQRPTHTTSDRRRRPSGKLADVSTAFPMDKLHASTLDGGLASGIGRSAGDQPKDLAQSDQDLGMCVRPQVWINKCSPACER